jgi:hypothetical protein
VTNDTKVHRIDNISSCSIEQLEVLGVTLREPRGEKSYFIHDGAVWVKIGLIGMHELDGRIHAVPRDGLTEHQTTQLLGFADDAFRNPPSEARAWRRDAHTPEWWSSTVAVPASQEEAAAALIAEAQRGKEA